jgi:hypothetical protein
LQSLPAPFKNFVLALYLGPRVELVMTVTQV